MEKQVVFRGGTADCLAHLAQAIGSDQVKRQTLTNFVGVTTATVSCWLKGQRLPTGEPLLRLRFYLEFLGYDVQELRSLDGVVRAVARLCAFQIVGLTEVSRLVGYADRPSGHNDTLLAIFRGAQGVNKDRLEKFESLVGQYETQLEWKVSSTPKIPLNGRATMESEIATKPAALKPLKPKSVLSFQDKRVTMEVLSNLIQATLPLTQYVESDQFTPQDRAALRDLVGGDSVFRLANSLYRLCGERARSMHRPTISLTTLEGEEGENHGQY